MRFEIIRKEDDFDKCPNLKVCDDCGLSNSDEYVLAYTSRNNKKILLCRSCANDIFKNVFDENKILEKENIDKVLMNNSVSNSKIYISNDFFEKLRNDKEFMEGRALELYFKLKLLDTLQGLKRGIATTEILDYCKISNRVFSDLRHRLLKYKFVQMEQYRNKNLYHLKKISETEVTEFEVPFIINILKDLEEKKITLSEFRVYIQLKQIVLTKADKGEKLNVTQDKLADLINFNRGNLSTRLTSLESKGYLKRGKVNKTLIVGPINSYKLLK